MDCAGDGGPGHPIQLGRRRMRQLQPQADQGDQHPVDEDQLVIGPGTSHPLPIAAPTFPERGLALRRPRVGQLLDQIAEMCMIKAAEGRMGQGRTGSVMRHNITNPCGRRHVTGRLLSPAGAVVGSRPCVHTCVRLSWLP